MKTFTTSFVITNIHLKNCFLANKTIPKNLIDFRLLISKIVHISWIFIGWILRFIMYRAKIMVMNIWNTEFSICHSVMSFLYWRLLKIINSQSLTFMLLFICILWMFVKWYPCFLTLLLRKHMWVERQRIIELTCLCYHLLLSLQSRRKFFLRIDCIELCNKVIF